MVVRFKKGWESHTLTCIREDGSSTWSKVSPATIFHDLGHYAVESVLGYQSAFYGLVKNGFNIEDFEAPREERKRELMPKNLPTEALVTEHLVNLLLVYIDNFDAISFSNTLCNVLKEARLPKLEIYTQDLEKIFIEYKRLRESWNILHPGEAINLDF